MDDRHPAHVGLHGKDIPLCLRFPEKHLPCLVEIGAEVRRSPGEVIVAPGWPATEAFVISKGAARVLPGSSNEASIAPRAMRLLGPGDFYGIVPMLDGQPYVSGLEATAETHTLTVSRGSFLSELDHHPETARDLLTQLADFLRQHEYWLP